MSGLRLCARALPSRGKRGPPLIAACGPLTIAAPPAAEHRLQTRRPSSRGPRAQPLRGMRDPPRPGLEPVSPALAGRLSTTAPPGKPQPSCFIENGAEPRRDYVVGSGLQLSSARYSVHCAFANAPSLLLLFKRVKRD